jgi:hypothetical protein
MIQCSECEFFRRGPKGEVSFACDPFSTIKEPECLAKWHLLKINQLVAGYQATLRYYDKFAPMQEKMFKLMEHEIDEMSESEKWKSFDEEEHDGQDDEEEEDVDEGETWR